MVIDALNNGKSSTSSGQQQQHLQQNPIEIRLYNDATDQQFVEELFITGTRSFVPSAVRQLIRQKAGVYIPLSLWCTSIASWLLYQTTLLIHGTKNNSNKSIIPYMETNNRFQSWIVLASMSLVATTLPFIWVYRGVASFMDDYINSSLQDDVRRIEDIYIRPGGTYLIAETVDLSSGSRNIVGMVGGEVKDNDTAIELRRMIVHPKFHKRGIGKILIKALEDETIMKQPQRSRMFLTTTSMQIAANKLYPSLGFQLTKIIHEPVPFVLQNFFRFHYYEKVYTKNK